jgi:hypothetical protein
MVRTLRSTILLLLLAALLGGCATYGIETSARITASDYRTGDKRHRSDIEVFLDKAPMKPYREVATIKAIGTDKSTQAGLIEAMQIRAAKIGVDGLVDFDFFTQSVTGGPTGSLHCPTWKECRYLGGDSYITSSQAAKATAIVYTAESEHGTRNPEPEESEKPTDETEKKKGPE